MTDILQAECENAEDEIREAFQVFDGVTIAAWHFKDELSLFCITFFGCKAFKMYFIGFLHFFGFLEKIVQICYHKIPVCY